VHVDSLTGFLATAVPRREVVSLLMIEARNFHT